MGSGASETSMMWSEPVPSGPYRSTTYALSPDAAMPRASPGVSMTPVRIGSRGIEMSMAANPLVPFAR